MSTSLPCGGGQTNQAQQCLFDLELHLDSYDRVIRIECKVRLTGAVLIQAEEPRNVDSLVIYLFLLVAERDLGGYIYDLDFFPSGPYCRLLSGIGTSLMQDAVSMSLVSSIDGRAMQAISLTCQQVSTCQCCGVHQFPSEVPIRANWTVRWIRRQHKLRILVPGIAFGRNVALTGDLEAERMGVGVFDFDG